MLNSGMAVDFNVFQFMIFKVESFYPQKQGSMFLPAFVCLFVCVSVCDHDN